MPVSVPAPSPAPESAPAQAPVPVPVPVPHRSARHRGLGHLRYARRTDYQVVRGTANYCVECRIFFDLFFIPNNVITRVIFCRKPSTQLLSLSAVNNPVPAPRPPWQGGAPGGEKVAPGTACGVPVFVAVVCVVGPL